MFPIIQITEFPPTSIIDKSHRIYEIFTDKAMTEHVALIPCYDNWSRFDLDILATAEENYENVIKLKDNITKQLAF